MIEKNISNQQEKNPQNKNDDRTKIIISWLEKIEKSRLTILDLFKKEEIPFSQSQYYLYRKQYEEFGESGIRDKRIKGGNKKLSSLSEAFIEGCVESNPNVSPQWLREKVAERYGCKLSPSGITRVLQRLNLTKVRRTRGKPRVNTQREGHNSCGGLELIIAIAYYLGWPQMTAETIKGAVKSLQEMEEFVHSDNNPDKKGRDRLGRFTSKYNQRKQVREYRFKSICEKRGHKNWKSMNVIRDDIKTIERKSLAILSLPVVTMNGGVRTVDSALGQELKHFAGFNYKQSSLTKYLNELKYLGVSANLLRELVTFWSKCWGSEMGELRHQTLLCYYIDGNTKAIWSSKRVKQNKVTMLGRVMGCMEHVFIHDCFGHPVYFETYSGHAPCGEYILELFEKIEDVIEEVPGSRTSVCRVLVMDSASNSVKTLRAFASQDKYHYITPLDDNQWNEQKVNSIGPPTRYNYGEATLREVIIELEDSQQKGYLVRSRGVKIDWDNGKVTVLLTSLPVEIVDSSEVVRSYFNRWPREELQFKSMKAVVSLNKVAGYGKQKIKDEKIVEQQEHTARMVSELKKALSEPLKQIRAHEEAIAELIPKERHHRNLSKIEEGKHKLPAELMEEFNSYGKQIRHHDREIKKIEKAHQEQFKLLRKHQREWLRLQGKETVYKVDVELDQILTFHRVSLANLYAYFIEYFLGGQPLSMINLLHKIIHLPATIEETDKVRKIVFDYNKKDNVMMGLLAEAIEKINALNVLGPQGKQMLFYLKK
jgi:transposase